MTDRLFSNPAQLNRLTAMVERVIDDVAGDSRIPDITAENLSVCLHGYVGTAIRLQQTEEQLEKHERESVRRHVREFHKAYDQPILEKPTIPSPDRVRLRIKLIAEEFAEFLVACGCTAFPDPKAFATYVAAESTKSVDMVELVDALGDLDYVVEGTRLEFGVDGGPIAAEIHRSNASKLGDDGKPVLNEDKKVVKGPRFSPPDIRGELIAQGWEPAT